MILKEDRKLAENAKSLGKSLERTKFGVAERKFINEAKIKGKKDKAASCGLKVYIRKLVIV